jgi:hypothetical protein
VSLQNPSENRRVGPLTLGGLALVFGSAAALPSHAAERCRLEVTGAEAPGWRDAVDSLDASAAEASDCAVIGLSVANDIAHLRFETKDGRVAKRELRHPSELAPTLDALLVTGLPAQPEPEPGLAHESRLAPPHPRAARLRRGAIVDESDSVLRTSRGDALTAAFGLQLGVRGGQGGLVSAVIHGQVTMDRSRWEMGVWGALEPEYASNRASRPVVVDMAPDEVRAVEPIGPDGPVSAGVVGIMVGRRVPFSHLDVIFGARLGVAAIRRFDNAADGAEVRVGAGTDLVFPRASTLHFRMGIGGEVVPNDMDRPDPGPLPSWALCARLGIEVGGP